MTSLEAMPHAKALREGRPTLNAPAARAFTVGVSSDVEAVSRAWLSLQMQGLATPYQMLSWQRAALEAFHPGERPCLITLRDGAGTTMALFPLVIRQRGGVRSAVFPGGKHANYNMGLFTPAACDALGPEKLMAALADAARMADIDLFDFRNQPTIWTGTANPLVHLPHQKAAASAWRADLAGDGETFVRSLMSSESRKKLRHKERRLSELGPVTYREAMTSAEAQAMLQAFLAQKAARFAAQGIRNPFNDPAARDFLQRTTVQGLTDGPPAPVSLFAMMAGERMLAVFGGIIHAGRFSGMFTSFDPNPTVSKYSPGDLLLLHLIKTMCDRGLGSFDLGTGDAGYKNDYCAIEEPLFDSFLPMTLKGRLTAMALAAGYRAKLALKRNRTLIQPLKRLLKR